MSEKVMVKLTAEQQSKISESTGQHIDSLTFEALEDRDAPTVFFGSKGLRINVGATAFQPGQPLGK